ncbi:MAG TPA: SDR family oxidoreductase [bacterium]|nr:SDR family oxidoreductase [bacterium]
MQGNAAIITGGGRGIGEAVALAFAREGARVVLAARTATELERVAVKVREIGGEVRIVPADVARPEDVDRVTRAALDAYGRIDALVNAAGILGPVGRVWEVDEGDWAQALQVNLYGTFLCCRAVLPHMVARRAGKIVNFSGRGATSPFPRFSAYAVSKVAVVRLTETLAEEVRDHNIQVNAIAPGMVDTRMQDHVLAAGERAGTELRRIRKLRDAGEGGVPADLAAQLTVFLASHKSDGLTGKLIAAPYDGWQSWDAARILELMAAPWLTIRRLDDFTLRPLLGQFADHRESPPDAGDLR